MRRIILTVITLFTVLLMQAQVTTGKLTVTIEGAQKTPLEGVTVELLRSKDSGLVKTAITDKAGAAELEARFGRYLLRASMVGYKTGYSPVITLDENHTIVTVPSMVLTAKTDAQLQEVTVTARKPFIQKLSDRIVVNVENSVVNVGSSALDVLERSPGVSIDQNDVIGLRGRQGVIVMIDGKPSPMSGTDLANYLRGLPSNAIESIHIITNPSAKYDASGNSGIIDIKMKKDQRLGYNGTLTAGYGQGVYPKANAGATFNYRNKTMNVFGSYNYAYRKLLNHLFINRNFFKDGVFMGSDEKDNYTTFPINTHSARMGADFFAGKKTIFGFVVNSSFNHLTRENDNHSIVNNDNYQPYYLFNTYATDNNHNKNAVANINFKHTFDSTGKEITADVDYGVFKSASLTHTATSYFNIDRSVKKPTDILDGDQNGLLTLKTGKVDLTNPMSGNAKLEAGAKFSYVTADNDAKFYNVKTTGVETDLGKTNHFFYNETNYAGYLNFRKEYKKFDFQIGLRAEQTQLKTHQEKGNIDFDSSYLQWFPSAFFNYKLKENQAIGISVSRRIDRPGYNQLNPFLFQIDATTYNTGNPHLLPQFTWSYELSYMLKSLNFTLGYSHTTQAQNVVIAKILDVIPTFEIKPGQDSNITVQYAVNLAAQDYFGLTVAAPIRINNWWNMINNANIYYTHFDGNLGGSKLDNGTPVFDLRTNNTFTFKKGWTSELNFNYSSGGQYGFMVGKPQWGLSAGVQKTVLKSKGTVRFNITDIFWTNNPKGTITYEGRYVENWHASRESRVANLSFTYRFGNNKVQAARKRTTASEEERQRVGQ